MSCFSRTKWVSDTSAWHSRSFLWLPLLSLPHHTRLVTVNRAIASQKFQALPILPLSSPLLTPDTSTYPSKQNLWVPQSRGLLLLHLKHSVQLSLRALLMLNWSCLFTVSLTALRTETVSYLSFYPQCLGHSTYFPPVESSTYCPNLGINSIQIMQNESVSKPAIPAHAMPT